MASVTARAPGKVNIGLAVGALRNDGYHELVSVFHALDVQDEVRASDRDDGQITCEVLGEGAADVPTGPQNLAVRAARLLGDYAGVQSGVHLSIRKRIPVAGGMAGGSADAAATLVACDALWHTDLGRAEMDSLGARLGSDVPFALLGGTAVGTGRGEILMPVLSPGHWVWVLALAPFGLSTPAVYRELDRLREGRPVSELEVPEALLVALRSGDPAELGPSLYNDMQAAALSLAPALELTLGTGLANGAVAGIVSGSGPTCAFLVDDADAAKVLSEALLESGTCRDTLIGAGPASGARVLGAG